MRRSYEFEIDEVKYQATTFPGRKGMSCVTRLLKLVGPSISSALTGMDTDAGTIQDKALSQAARSLIDNMDSDKVITLVDDLLDTVEYWNEDGKKKKADLDNYFSANYGTLFRVLFIVIKENYTSFFGGSVSNLLDLLPKGLLPKSKEG